jgi:hypothetical protein
MRCYPEFIEGLGVGRRNQPSTSWRIGLTSFLFMRPLVEVIDNSQFIKLLNCRFSFAGCRHGFSYLNLTIAFFCSLEVMLTW